MKSPCSPTLTLVRAALGAALLTACGDAPAVVDTDSASGGQTTTAPTTTAPPTTADESDSGTDAATDGDSDSATTGPGTLSSEPTTGGCPPDALECAGACVDPLTDQGHCGGCDAPCQPGERCELGTCVLTCDPDQTLCRGACVDTTVDPAHCGGCDSACDPGLSCQDSACLELELCDGVDNDADRSVDEGFPDLDADGTADCVDDACDIADVAPTMVPIDKTCLSPDVVVEDPWNAVIEYQFKDGSVGSRSAPVVGQLTDDNQDGAIDEQDFPDVAIITQSPNRVVALEPATGTVHWSVPVSEFFGTLIADVNADGKNDVVTVNPMYRPTALDGATGATLWTNPALTIDSFYVPQVADVDADGLPEVLFGKDLLNGEDGTVVRSYPEPPLQSWGATMADLDLDGVQEVILSKRVYAPDSNIPLWTAPLASEGWPVVLNADDDPEAEVAIVGYNQFGVWNHDGSQIHLTALPFGGPGPSVAADFDGDGAVELAWAVDMNLLQVHELDGTKLWSAPIAETSGYAGCSAYDFDGDGAYELLYADEADFRIYDGATGMVRFVEPGHDSDTGYEYPTVADVDNDGSAEILFVSNDVPDFGTLTVLGHPDSAWLPVGPSWGNHDFAVTNLLQNNHVPTQPVPSWQAYNLFRARPSIDDAAVDLTVQVIDACVSGCADSSVATLAVQVFNTGFITVDAGVPVTLYRKDGDTLEPVETIVLPDPIPGGTGTAGLLFTVPVASIGADGLVVRVDDDGLGGSVQFECAESNNEAAWTANPC
jgi:outer membrane protein assembly factor BamB